MPGGGGGCGPRPRPQPHGHTPKARLGPFSSLPGTLNLPKAAALLTPFFT